MTKEAQRLKAQATRMLENHDKKDQELRAIKRDLQRICTAYGRAAGIWGLSPDHLRIQLEYERAKES